MDEITQRKEKVFGIFRQKKNYLFGLILAFIIWFSVYIRTRNLSLLTDITTGKYIPADPDAMGFLRYIKIVAEQGSLPALDTLRYYPFGYNPQGEFSLLSHLIYWMYKILHLFIPSMTLEKAHVIYPAIAFIFALIFFYLFVNKLFNKTTAIIATAYLAVIPSFLFRTMSGISDKEAFAVVFLFASFYFFIAGWKEENIKKLIAFGILAGISTGLTGLIWGGVGFVFLTISLFAILELVLNHVNKKRFIVYGLWLFFSFLLLNRFYNRRFTIPNLIESTVTSVAILAFVAMVLFFAIKKYAPKLSEKYPLGISSVIVSAITGIFFLILENGISYIPYKIYDIFVDMARPFSRNRWALTVAESHQPYFIDWVGNFGWFFIILFILASILMIYNLLKNINLKSRIIFTIFYALCMLGFILNRYSMESSVFNGQAFFANFVYIGSLSLFVGISGIILVYSFYKNKELFKSITQFDNNILFALVLFLVMLIAGRSALRLLFVLTPAVVLLTAYLFERVYNFALNLKIKHYRYTVFLILAILIFIPISSVSLAAFASSSLNTAKHIGLNYDPQWQTAMDWVRKNTSEDSVFAHWWDYGYYVQTGGERATLSDGGNAQPLINQYVGRYVLTAQNNTQALEFLKTYGADYLLVVQEEIGKYPAYSSIGSDQNMDRYSYIPTFSADPNEITESRENLVYLFKGQFVLDEDLIYNGKLFASGSSVIAGFFVPVKLSENSSGQISQPIAAVFNNNGERFDLPLKCIYFNGQEINFENSVIKGCLRIVPTITDAGKAELFMTALYTSEKVTRTLFSQLYLYNKNWPGFDLVYSDEQLGYSLAYYPSYGRMIGPFRIWKINPSANIKTKPELLNLSYVPEDIVP